MAKRLDSKVAIITGGASAIGRATAELFWAEGAAHVVVADLNEAGAKEVALLRDGVETQVPAETLRVGDVFVVRPGEKVATDGEVVANILPAPLGPPPGRPG